MLLLSVKNLQGVSKLVICDKGKEYHVMITLTKWNKRYRKAISPMKKSRVTIQKLLSKTSKKVVHENDFIGFRIKK